MLSRLPALALAIAISAPARAAPPERPASAKENLGFGIGAVVGGLLGGPPGAVIGAAGGAWIGSHDTKQDKKRASLEHELAHARSRLAAVSDQLAQARSEARGRTLSLEQLQHGVSFDVYFRTDQDAIEPELRRQVAKLAEALHAYPSVAVDLSGYADRRGPAGYNMRLSRRRVAAVRRVLVRAGLPPQRIHCRAFGDSRATAALGDQEGYVFDRRVTLDLRAPVGATLAGD